MSAPVPAAIRPPRGLRSLLPGLPWLLALGLVLRLILIFYKGNRYYFADTAEYAAAARGILGLQGVGAGYIRAPLYPLFMSLGFLLGGENNYQAVRLLQLLVGMGVVILTAVLARRMGSPERGRLAALAAAVAPTLVFTSSMLYPTALYTLLLLAATLGVLALEQRPSAARAAFLGAAMGLMWLTDAIALGTLAALLLWLIVAARRRVAKALTATALALLVAVLVAIPYESWHRLTYGSSGVFLGKAQYQLYMVRRDPELGGRRELRDTTRVFKALPTGQFVARELRLMRQQTRAYWTDYAHEFLHFFDPLPDRLATRNTFTRAGPRLVAALYFAPVLLLALIGLFAGAVRARYRVLLLVAPLATAATYAFFFTQTRYRVPVEPALLVLAALGLQRVWPRRWRALAPADDGVRGAGRASASVAETAEHL